MRKDAGRCGRVREPQIEISSQVRSTGLCHLSACYLIYFKSLMCLSVFAIFTLNLSVSVLVSLLSPEIDPVVDRRGLVFQSKM
jgi:hypothetical protein